MYKKNVGLYSFLLVIATLFLGVAYANVTDTKLLITGDASIIVGEEPEESPQNNNEEETDDVNDKENSNDNEDDDEGDLEIIDVGYKESLNANIEDSKVLNIAKTLLQSLVKLEKEENAYITFSVTIKNNTHNDLYYIETTKSDDFYHNLNEETNNQIIYELDGVNENTMIAKDGGEITFDLIFKYDNLNTEDIKEENQVLNSYLNFKFKKIYHITYVNIENNNYIDKLVDGENYTITFLNDIPDNVIVTGDVNSSYDNGVLTLTDINSDIVITKDSVKVSNE